MSDRTWADTKLPMGSCPVLFSTPTPFLPSQGHRILALEPIQQFYSCRVDDDIKLLGDVLLEWDCMRWKSEVLDGAFIVLVPFAVPAQCPKMLVECMCTLYEIQRSQADLVE